METSNNNNNTNTNLMEEKANKHRDVMNIGHVITCLLPICSGLLLISVLVLLIMSTENHDINGQSISRLLSLYEPYQVVLLPMLVSSGLMFIVTLCRNIQVRVYYSRRKQYTTTISAINKLATIANILAYIAFIILSFNKDEVNQYADNVERNIHEYSLIAYFIFSILYAMLHTSLMLLQKKDEGSEEGGGIIVSPTNSSYPLLLKINFASYTFVIVVCSIWFLFHMYSESISGKITILEWIAVLFNALYICLFSILFHIDPIENEVYEFFFQGGCLTYFNNDIVCKSSIEGEEEPYKQGQTTAPTIDYTNNKDFDYQATV